MDRMIYVGMGGAKMDMQRQEVLANNLANASTTGFRAELHAIRAVPVRGDGSSTRVYALETTLGYDDTAGPINFTGRPLDVAVGGKSWLSVQGLDGTEAYTRFGALTVDNEGNLKTQNGYAVMGDGGPITVPPNTIPSIAADGTVVAKGATGPAQTVGRIKLVTPENKLQRGPDGLFRNPDGDLPLDATARLQDGALEGSNVNPIETMVAMISAGRQYETQMRLLKSAEENEQTSTKLLSNS